MTLTWQPALTSWANRHLPMRFLIFPVLSAETQEISLNLRFPNPLMVPTHKGALDWNPRTVLTHKGALTETETRYCHFQTLKRATSPTVEKDLMSQL